MAYVPEEEDEAPEAAPIPRGTRIATPDDQLSPETPEVGDFEDVQAGDGGEDIGATALGNQSIRDTLAVREANEAAKQRQLAKNPFLFSNAIKPATRREVQQAQRSVDVDAREQLQEYRRQQIDARRQAAAQRKAANFARTEEFRSKGMLYRLDVNGVPQPVVEASTGRQLYNASKGWERAKHPKDGRPAKVKMDRYGQLQYTDYPMVESNDPTEGRFYYDLGEGETAPAMTYEEAAASKDPGLAKKGLVAIKKKVVAERQEALAGMEIAKDAVMMKFKMAENEAAKLGLRIQQLQAAGGDPEEIRKLQDQQYDIDEQIREGTGPLRLMKDVAETSYNVEKIKAQRDAYLLQRDLVATNLRERGIDPLTNQTFVEHEKALSAFNKTLAEAEAKEAQLDKMMGAPIKAAPVAAPTAAPSTISELGKLGARGATSEGLYAASEGAATLFSQSPIRRMMNAAEDWATEKIQGFPLTEQQKATREKLRARALEKTGAATVDRFAKDYAKATSDLRNQIRRALPVDEKVAQSTIGQIAQGAGQLAGTAPLAVFGGAGIAAASVGQIYDEAFQDAKQAGQDDATAHSAAMKYLPAAALDFLADRMVIGKLLKPLQGKMTVGQLLKDVIATAAAEGSTEGGQQLYLNTIAKKLEGYDPNRPLDKEVLDSVIVGAAVGGGATTVGRGARMIGGQPPAGDAGQVPPATPTAPTEPAATPSQNFPTTDQAAPVEQPDLTNVRQMTPEETAAQERQDVMSQFAAEATPNEPATRPAEVAAEAPVSVGEVAPINTPEAEPEVGAAIPAEQPEAATPLQEPAPAEQPSQSNARQEAEQYIFSDDAHKEAWIKAKETSDNYARLTADESTHGTPERAAARKAKNEAQEALPSGKTAPRKDNPLSSVLAYSRDDASEGSETDLTGAQFDGPANANGTRRVKTKDGGYAFVKENQLYPEQVKALAPQQAPAPVTAGGVQETAPEPVAPPATTVATDDEAAIEAAAQAQQQPRPLPENTQFLYEQNGVRYYQIPDAEAARGSRTVDEATLRSEGFDTANLPTQAAATTTEEPTNAIQEQSPATLPVRQASEGGAGVRQGNEVVQEPAGTRQGQAEGQEAVQPLGRTIEGIRKRRAKMKAGAAPVAEGRVAVSPETDELLGTNERGEPIYWSRKANTHYAVSDGRIRTAPNVAGLPESAIDRLHTLTSETAEELPPPAQMRRDALRAELKAAGVETVSGGVPVEDAAPNQLMAAVGKLRQGKLEETKTAPAKSIEDRLRSAKRMPKRRAEGQVLSLGPDTAFDMAHDAAIDVAIVAIKAGRAIKEAVEMAVKRFRAAYPKATDADVARARASIEAAIQGPPPPAETKGVGAGEGATPNQPPSGQTFTGPVQPGGPEFRKRSKSSLGEYEYAAASTDDAKRKYAKEFADHYEKQGDMEKAVSDMRAIDQASFRSVVASELLGRTMEQWDKASVADKPTLMARAQSLIEDIKAGKTEAAQALQAEGLVNKRLAPFVPMLDWMDLLRARYKTEIAPKVGGEETAGKVKKGIKDAGDEAAQDLETALTAPEGEKPKVKNEKAFNEWLNRYASTLNLLRKGARNRGMSFKDIFSSLPENQEARRAELYERVKDEPKLKDLSGAQKKRLAENLDEAWTELRNNVFRQEFGRLVPLPKVKPENAAKVKSVIGDIIKYSNMGILNNDTFLRALADKYGIEGLDGPTSKKLGELAAKMQRATTESEKARTLLEMSNTLARAKGITVGETLMSGFYSNLLNSLVTMTYAMTGGNIMQTTWSLGTLAATAAKNPSLAGAIGRGFKTGIPQGLREALSIITTGHGGEDAASKLVEARGEPLELLAQGGMTPKLAAKSPLAAKTVQNLARVARMTSRMARAIDVMYYAPSKQAALRFLTEQSLLADYPDPKQRAERAAEILQVRPQDFAAAEAKAKAEGFEGLDMSLRIADLLEPMSAIGKIKKASETTRFLSDVQKVAQSEAIGDALYEEGTRFGTRSTLSMEPEGWAGVLYQGMSNTVDRVRPKDFPVLKLAFPFLRLPTNFYNANLMATPFGGLAAAIGSTPTGKMVGGKMVRRQLTRNETNQMWMQSAIGSSLMAYFVLRAMNADPDDDKAFDITANGPSDKALRRQLETHGWKKKSFRIPGTNTRVDYMNSPLAMPLTIAGHVADAYRYGKPKEELIGGKYLPGSTVWDKALLDAASRFPAIIFGLPALSGMQELSELLDEENADSERITNFFTRTGKNFIRPRIIEEVDRIFDPIVKDDGLVRYDELGDPVERSPLSRVAKTESKDPVRKFLLSNRLKIPVAGKQTMIDGRQMTPEQFQKYMQLSGGRVKARLNQELPRLKGLIESDKIWNKTNVPAGKPRRNSVQDFISVMVEKERARAKEAVRRWSLTQPAAAR